MTDIATNNITDANKPSVLGNIIVCGILIFMVGFIGYTLYNWNQDYWIATKNPFKKHLNIRVYKADTPTSPFKLYDSSENTNLNIKDCENAYCIALSNYNDPASRDKLFDRFYYQDVYLRDEKQKQYIGKNQCGNQYAVALNAELLYTDSADKLIEDKVLPDLANFSKNAPVLELCKSDVDYDITGKCTNKLSDTNIHYLSKNDLKMALFGQEHAKFEEWYVGVDNELSKGKLEQLIIDSKTLPYLKNYSNYIDTNLAKLDFKRGIKAKFSLSDYAMNGEPIYELDKTFADSKKQGLMNQSFNCI